MTSTYPAQIDNSLSLPPAVDSQTPVNANSVNQLRTAILNIETALGTNPGGVYGSVGAAIISIANSIGNGGVQIGQDLGGTLHSPLVVGIYGRPVSSVAPVSGQSLTWNGIAWVPTNLDSSVALVGDVTGLISANTISSLQGFPLSIVGPTTGQFLTYNGSRWVNSSGNFVAGGDLSGTATSQTVIRIQGRSVSNTAPTTGQSFVWNGSAWTPTSFSGAVTLAGDVTGTAGANAIAELQGYPLVISDPLNGQVLTYNTSEGKWINGASSGFVPGGDLSGTSTSQEVIGILNKAISPTTLVTGNVLQYNGTNWVPTTITLGGAAGGALSGTYPNPTISLTSNSGISGVLPTANQAAQTMTGDVTGTTGANILVKVTGSGGFVPFAATITGQSSGSGFPYSLGVLGLSMGSDSNVTLSASQLINPFVRVTSTVSLTATRTVFLPATTGAIYYVYNSTTGGQSLIFQASTGTGITVPNGLKAVIYFDGTNYVVTNIEVGGDLSATSNTAQKVIAIQGNPVEAQVLGSAQDGYVLTWTNASLQNIWKPAGSITSLSGDVDGYANANTVVGIDGYAIVPPILPGTALVAGLSGGSHAGKLLPTGVTPVLTAAQFGATGQSGHDDTAALQAMLDAAKALGGARCYINPSPSGSYMISSPLFIDGTSSDDIELFSDKDFTTVTDYVPGTPFYVGSYLGPTLAICPSYPHPSYYQVGNINMVDLTLAHGNNGAYLRLSETGCGFLNGLAEITVECFVYLNSYGTAYIQPIIYSGGGVGPGGQYSTYPNGYPYHCINFGLTNNGYLGADLCTTANKHVQSPDAGYPQWNGALTSGLQVPLHTLTHIAFSYDGSHVRFFVNGVLDTTLTNAVTGTLVQDQSENLTFGGALFSSYPKSGMGFFGQLIDTTIDGYIGSFRMSGTAEYTTSFSPPTSELTTDSFTIFLQNFDTSNRQRGLFLSGISTYQNDLRIIGVPNIGPQRTYTTWYRWNSSVNDGQAENNIYIHDLGLQKKQTGAACYAQLTPFLKFERVNVSGTCGFNLTNNCFEMTMRQIVLATGNIEFGPFGTYTADCYGILSNGAANANTIEDCYLQVGYGQFYDLIIGGATTYIKNFLTEGASHAGNILFIAQPDGVYTLDYPNFINEAGGCTDACIRLLNQAWNQNCSLTMIGGSGSPANGSLTPAQALIAVGPWAITNENCFIAGGNFLGVASTSSGIGLSSNFNTASVLPYVNIISTGFPGLDLQVQTSLDAGNTLSSTVNVPSSGYVIGGTTTLCPDNYTGTTIPDGYFYATGTLSISVPPQIIITITSSTTYTQSVSVTPEVLGTITQGAGLVLGGNLSFFFPVGTYVAGTVYTLQLFQFDITPATSTFTAPATIIPTPTLSFYSINGNKGYTAPPVNGYLPGISQPPVTWNCAQTILFGASDGGYNQQNIVFLDGYNPAAVVIEALNQSYKQLYWHSATSTAYVDSTSFMYGILVIAGPSVTTVILPTIVKGYTKKIVNNTPNSITVGGSGGYGGTISGSSVTIGALTSATLTSIGTGWVQSDNTVVTTLALTGDVTGLTDASTVSKISGASPIDITATETILNSGGTAPIYSIQDGYVSTNATIGTAGTFALSANTTYYVTASVVCQDQSGAGTYYAASFAFIASRASTVNSGNAVLSSSTPTPYNVITGNSSTATASVTLSSNTLQFQCTGIAATTLHWSWAITCESVS
jgi:hypothetical protein